VVNSSWHSGQREEVNRPVKYFEFTKKWVVKVEDKDDEPEARKLIASDSEKYLKSETVTRTEYKQRPQQKSGNGWVTAAKDQLLGTNSRTSY
jgi:hypothetical protein